MTKHDSVWEDKGALKVQSGLRQTLRRGGEVLTALRREYEPRLWRMEALAQGKNLVTGSLAGRRSGRDHDDLNAYGYRPRDGGARLWIRHGSGDAAVWGELNVRREYETSWCLPADLRVLDLGGHVGYFGRWALKNWSVASLISVEPDVGNFTVLRRNHEALAEPGWQLLQAAAASSEGLARFAGGRGCGSGLGSEGEDEVRTVDALKLFGV